MAKKNKPIIPLDVPEESSVQDSNSPEVAKLQKAFMKGFSDKTGEGLNANVLKLTKEMKNLQMVLTQQLKASEVLFKSISKGDVKDTKVLSTISNPFSTKSAGGVIKGGFYGDYAQYDSTDAQGRASIESAKKYAGPKGGGGIKGALKRNFTMEGWFGDIADAPVEEQGLLGRFGARKVRENRFVEEQKKLGKSNLYEIRTNFREKEKIQRQQGETEAEISKLVESGWSEENIAKHKKTKHLLETRGRLDKELKSKDIGYRYRRSREDREEQESETLATPEVAAPVVPTPAAPQTGESSTEVEQENIHMMEQQNLILQEIAENTKPLADMVKVFETKPTKDESTPVSADDSSSLPAVASIIPAVSAAKGLVTGGAEGAVAKGAGRFIPGLGTAIAVGGGAYDAYTGITAANEAEESGQITHEQGNIQRGGAVGRGVGGAGGALAGAAAGAALGSAVPVVGTAIGGMIGGALGYWGGSKVGGTVGETGAEGYNYLTGQGGAQEPKSRDATAEERIKVTGTEDPNWWYGQGKALGPSYERAELRKHEQWLRDHPEALAPGRADFVGPPDPNSGAQVYNMSAETSAKPTPKVEAPPTVVSAPTVNNNSTTVFPSKSPARNTDSSYQKYAFDSRFDV